MPPALKLAGKNWSNPIFFHLEWVALTLQVILELHLEN